MQNKKKKRFSHQITCRTAGEKEKAAIADVFLGECIVLPFFRDQIAYLTEEEEVDTFTVGLETGQRFFCFVP